MLNRVNSTYIFLQVRGKDSQQATEDLHKQLIEAEAFRMQVTARAERQQGEVSRLEQEMTAEARAQEAEVADITASYQRLEKVVVAHLQGLQKAMLGDAPTMAVSQQQTTSSQRCGEQPAHHLDDSVLSCSFNDENVFNSMRASNVV